ncbi:MAG: cytidine deaminase [Pseudomonadota bacterium]
MAMTGIAGWKALLHQAKKASMKAYAPYSGIRVGAAAIAASSKVYTGSNVENASFGLTACAERVAIQNAVSAGERKILAVAVFSPDIRSIMPCGACRQVMAEFSGPDGPLIIVEGKNGIEAIPLEKLLPRAFGRSPL